MENTQLEFGGLRSSVVVDSADVPHYEVQYNGGAKEVTSWIVSEPEKPFAVHARLMDRLPGESYTIQVCLDGHTAAGVLIRPQDYSLWHASSTRVSRTETRNFMFGSLELSDDDALLEASSAKAIGEIKILLYRVGAVVQQNREKSYVPPPQSQKVHERAKKGLAHSVKYGGTQIDPLRPTSHFSCVDQMLIASHIIKYRPLAMLQANGIVPYVSANNQHNAAESPSPVPGPSSARKKRKALEDEDVKPDINNLSDNDEERIIRKEKELKEQLAQLQKKRARLQRRPAIKVEQEERKPILHGEIIDLTL